MKIFHSADWHLGKYLNDYSLLPDQEVFLTQFIDAAANVRPDAIVLAGDLYDRSVPSADAVSLLDRTLQALVLELHIKTFVIAGNHDSADRLQFASGLLSKSGLHIAAKEPKTVTLQDEYGEVDFHLLPYLNFHQMRALLPDQPPQSIQEGMLCLLQKMQDQFQPGRRNLLVTHGFFASGTNSTEETAVGGSELISIDRSFASAFSHILLGHLHGAHSAGMNARYSGSPLKYSVDEANQKKSWDVIELTDQNVHITPGLFTPLRDVRVLNDSFSALLKGPRTEDYVSLHLTDEQPVPDAALQLKSVYPKLLELHWDGLVFHSNLTLPETAVLESGNLQTLFADFYEQLTGKPLSDVQHEILSESGVTK